MAAGANERRTKFEYLRHCISISKIAMARTVHCTLGKDAEVSIFLRTPELGKRIYENVSKGKWRSGSSTRRCWSTRTA
jgi:hypothetical protein